MEILKNSSENYELLFSQSEIDMLREISAKFKCTPEQLLKRIADTLMLLFRLPLDIVGVFNN